MSRKKGSFPAQADVTGAFHYEPQTGVLVRRKTGQAVAPGMVRVDKKHRMTAKGVIWIYMTGNPPRWYVVPENGDESDLRWENLHDLPMSEISLSRRKRRREHEGLERRGESWVVTITAGRKTHYVGSFKDENEAVAARERKRSEILQIYARVRARLSTKPADLGRKAA